MNTERYKMAAIREFARMIRKLDNIPDDDNFPDFSDTKEEILNLIIGVAGEENTSLELFGYLLEFYFTITVKTKFPEWIVYRKYCKIDYKNNYINIEFSDVSNIFRKLNLEELKNEFFNGFEEFMNYEIGDNKYLFDFKFSLTPVKNNFVIEINVNKIK